MKANKKSRLEKGVDPESASAMTGGASASTPDLATASVAPVPVSAVATPRVRKQRDGSKTSNFCRPDDASCDPQCKEPHDPKRKSPSDHSSGRKDDKRGVGSAGAVPTATPAEHISSRANAPVSTSARIKHMATSAARFELGKSKADEAYARNMSTGTRGDVIMKDKRTIEVVELDTKMNVEAAGPHETTAKA
jgi:hypothetical protein